MNCLIVTGGNIDFEFATELIKTNQYKLIIAADSGMHFLFKAKIIPNVIVGDFDSVSEEVLNYYSDKKDVEIHKLNPMKNDTDTEYAMRCAIKKGVHCIDIIGGTGSRLDHVMGNINLLGIGFEENVEISLVDKNNRIRLINQNTILYKEQQFGKYVSLIPYSPKVDQVVLKGFKYPLNDYTMGGFNSLGISNEIVDNEAEISFSDGIFILIESRD